MDIFPQFSIERLWWEPFVAPTVKSDACMRTHATGIVLSILQEKHIVIRIRSISRISQPEVLPYHDTMLIASLVESLVANLSYPVTNHGAVHLLVIPYSNIVLT